MEQENTSAATQNSSAIGGFDALRIHDDKFIVTIGEDEYAFETPKDALGRIISINGNGQDRKISYGMEMSRSSAGVEYEQIYSELPDLIPPKINQVGIDTLDSDREIYRLSISRGDYTLDSGAVPFFFFNSWEGTFENYAIDADGSVAVDFKVNLNTGGTNAYVTAGIGDSLGRVHRKTIMLKGAY